MTSLLCSDFLIFPSSAILQSPLLLQNKNDTAKFGTDCEYFAYKIAKQFYRPFFDIKEYFYDNSMKKVKLNKIVMEMHESLQQSLIF